jgi:DNA-binding XRE family transcriptional regulator
MMGPPTFGVIHSTLICSWSFCSWDSTNSCVIDQAKFFRALGQRVRGLRRKAGYSQEDMISFGFSARHWQQIEAGRPITITTALRICATFEISIERLVRRLDRGIY